MDSIHRLAFLNNGRAILVHAAVKSTNNLSHESSISFTVVDLVLEEVPHCFDLCLHASLKHFVLQPRWHLLKELIFVVECMIHRELVGLQHLLNASFVHICRDFSLGNDSVNLRQVLLNIV